MMRFPALYPDEHVYSAFIRARCLSGQMHLSTHRFFELNNLKYHWLRSQVPLCANLASVMEIMVLDNEQLFGVRLMHTPLAPWLMSAEEGTLPKELTHTGTRSNVEETPLSVDKRWKFCVACAQEEKGKLGVSYWHSSHQLPGARVCFTHQMPLHSLDELRYLDFTLPHHWLDKALPLALVGDWQRAWQPFIYIVSDRIKLDIDWPRRVKSEVIKYLNLEMGVKRSDRPKFEALFETMTQELGQDCLAGLFTAFAPHRQRRPNLLWLTLSGYSQAKGLRHPLYWLVIIFWLRNELPECRKLL